ncbi:Ger(x)C family spore germination protein [Clostridium fungisolvens]|uniref:Spore germination protein A3 n=1 Tax=Clostridium fungisolvens TaxID=1604897 RepID=A0A6V8SD94_9CLOT|nr:Ger(x)C family spore germination protein [Clostridium fungisolvens]GFP74425.1 Spore germination protein A3 [Clostridium fungisolvens]
MIKKYNKLACILLLSIFLTGCWDYEDIDKRTITISAGVDILNDEIEITGENVKLGSATSREGNMSNNLAETYKYKAVGKTFEDTRKNRDIQIPAISFDKTAIAFVVSKRYAEQRGIESYINKIYFGPGLRSSIHVSVSKEPMDELFNKKLDNAESIGYGIEQTLRYLEKEGTTVLKSVQQLQSDINFGSLGYLLPYITVEDNTVKLLGSAVMVDSKLAYIIKQDEIGGFLLMLSKRAGDTRAIPSPSDDKNLLSIKSDLSKRSIRTSYEDNKINIYIDLKLKSEVQFQYHMEPFTNEDKKKVEAVIGSLIKENVLSAVSRSQNEFKSDVFGFARYFKAENPRIYKTINWKEDYTKAVFHVSVNTTIIDTGVLNSDVE